MEITASFVNSSIVQFGKPKDDDGREEKKETTRVKPQGKAHAAKESENSKKAKLSSTENVGFSKVLEGVVFVLSGFVNPKRSILKSRALEMRAEYQPDWNSNCSLLVVHSQTLQSSCKLRLIVALLFQSIHAQFEHLNAPCQLITHNKLVNKAFQSSESAEFQPNYISSLSRCMTWQDWILECYNQSKLVDIEKYLMHAGKPWQRGKISLESSQGMLLSAIFVIVAAIVENEWLEVAKEHGPVDMPVMMVQMSVWWLVPWYVLFGVAHIFTMVGLQEFFYDQLPNELRVFLISAIEKAAGGDGRDSWFANNLNPSHLDYFYWLLVKLYSVELSAYLYFPNPTSIAGKGGASGCAKEIFSPSEVKKWAFDDLNRTISWLESQDEKPELREWGNMAAEGILTCLQDAIESLQQEQESISAGFPPNHCAMELHSLGGRGAAKASPHRTGNNSNSLEKQDLCKRAMACKKIIVAELRQPNIDSSNKRKRKTKAHESEKDVKDLARLHDADAAGDMIVMILLR
ncbi:BRCT domain [Dillenia turbinata]|uniref:BRCT domain n=1 Tax=Dillenia turbinata TaxID=194707 RepID=A0AAN8U886_9MAGN